jgi:hypothetical protein
MIQLHPDAPPPLPHPADSTPPAPVPSPIMQTAKDNRHLMRVAAAAVEPEPHRLQCLHRLQCPHPLAATSRRRGKARKVIHAVPSCGTAIARPRASQGDHGTRPGGKSPTMPTRTASRHCRRVAAAAVAPTGHQRTTTRPPLSRSKVKRMLKSNNSTTTSTACPRILTITNRNVFKTPGRRVVEPWVSENERILGARARARDSDSYGSR